uniref:Serine hydrolase n=1 Tax=Steinernema glaseri TaxID=37863 RepID=A0A1I7ZB84_9BILA
MQDSIRSKLTALYLAPSSDSTVIMHTVLICSQDFLADFDRGDQGKVTRLPEVRKNNIPISLASITK